MADDFDPFQVFEDEPTKPKKRSNVKNKSKPNAGDESEKEKKVR